MSEEWYTDIERLIPHRAPMICIDRFKRIDADRALSRVRFAPESYGSHDGWISAFMLIEAVAQTAAAHIGYAALLSRGHKPVIGMLAAVDAFEWQGRVKAGQAMEIQICKTDEIGAFKLLKAQIRTGSTPVAHGRIKVFHPPAEGGA